MQRRSRRRVVADFETRSRVMLRGDNAAGAWIYSKHPSTKVLCLNYKIDDNKIRTWVNDPDLMDPGMPQDLQDAIDMGLVFEAHNAAFERYIWRHQMVEKFDWREPPMDRWRDTMAACAYYALPLGLDEAARVLELEHQKNPDGDRLIRKLSKPRKPTKKDPSEWCEDPIEHQRMYDYGADDVASEHELGERLSPLPAPELAVWRLDSQINDRGVKIDVEAVIATLGLLEAKEKALTEELVEITGGAVQTAGQRDKMMAFLKEQDHPMVDLTSDSVESSLNYPDTPPTARRVLEIRQSLARASTKKLRRMLLCADPDDHRARGLLQYHGATTGRWAGRLIQPQNFPRPTTDLSVHELIDVLGKHDLETVEMLVGDVHAAAANALKGYLISDEGRTFVSGDFKSIEAVVLAGLAGEEKKLDLFRAGADVYCSAAENVFGRPINKSDDPEERQVGKICELAFGYQGGVGAWRSFDSSDNHTDEQVEGYRDAWRQGHPKIVSFWHDLNRAAIDAVITGEARWVNDICYKMERDWLTCRLPSERLLWYFRPQVTETPMPWDHNDRRPQVSYWTMTSGKGGGRRWTRARAYGGLLAENVTQAAARDIMVPAMHKVEAAKFPIVLTVHDEILTEPRLENADLEKFTEIMEQRPDWAADWPINVDPWIDTRYHK